MRRTVAGISLGLVLGLLAGGGFVWATIPDSNTGVATACYPTSGASKGDLRVIDAQAGEVCPAGQARLFIGTPQCGGYPHAGLNWRNCDFHGGNFTGQYMTSGNLTNANFALAAFQEARLNASNLTGANLSGTNFSNADLRLVNVTNANLSGATLVGVNLTGLIGLSQAQLDSIATEGPASNVDGCGTGGTGPRLDSVIFGAVNLSGFDLTRVFMPNSKLRASNLSGANLTSARINGVDFRDANLASASLGCADLRYANLEGANLTGTDLSTVSWENTKCPDGTNSDANGDTCVGHL